MNHLAAFESVTPMRCRVLPRGGGFIPNLITLLQFLFF